MNQNKKHLSKPLRQVSTSEYLSMEAKKAGLNKNELAEVLKTTRQTLHNIQTNGIISRAMAERLSESFGKTTDFWLRTHVFIDEQNETVEKARDSRPESRLPDSTIVQFSAPSLLVDFMIREAVLTGQLTITPFIEDNIRPATYDFTIGSTIEIDGQGEIDLTKGDYELKKNERAVITTAETVVFPKDFLARVGPLTEHSIKGLAVQNGIQIDPGYSGQLQVSAFHTGLSSFTLFKGQPILSIEIFRLGTPPRKSWAETVRKNTFHERVARELETAFHKLFPVGQFSNEEFVRKNELLNIEHIGTDKDDLLSNCMEELLTGIQFATSQAFLDIASDAGSTILLNNTEIEALFDILGVTYNATSGSAQLPNKETIYLTLSNSNTCVSLSTIAKKLNTSPSQLALYFIGIAQVADLWHVKEIAT